MGLLKHLQVILQVDTTRN